MGNRTEILIWRTLGELSKKKCPKKWKKSTIFLTPPSYQKVRILNCGLFYLRRWPPPPPFWTFSTFRDIFFLLLPLLALALMQITVFLEFHGRFWHNYNYNCLCCVLPPSYRLLLHKQWTIRFFFRIFNGVVVHLSNFVSTRGGGAMHSVTFSTAFFNPSLYRMI